VFQDQDKRQNFQTVDARKLAQDFCQANNARDKEIDIRAARSEPGTGNGQDL
jgi:hypothetical protein